VINIKDKKNCCGCQACGDACPKSAISFKTDNEGFWYPEVDKAMCVNCGLCERTCPVLVKRASDKVEGEGQCGGVLPRRARFERPKCVAANHKNIEVRFDSTSGGMFTAFADWAFANGYHVGGAIFTDDWGAQNFISNNKEDLLRLRNSKYVQANAAGFYRRVRELLSAGEKVLVCNLPCQIAALQAFLAKPYENLITVDLFCRAINSPLVFRKFLDSLEKRYESKVVYIKPKSKDLGWHRLTLKIVFANGKTYYGTKDVDFFTQAFLNTNCISRPSCYDCRFKGFPRVADMSIGDFWLAGDDHPISAQLDDNLGTSVVLVNSPRGEALLQSVEKNLKTATVDLDVVVRGNRALVESIPKEKVDRKLFYSKVNSEDFQQVVEAIVAKPKLSLKRRIRNVLATWKWEVFQCAHWHPWPILQFAYYNLLCSAVHGVALTEKRAFYICRHCDIELYKESSLTLRGSLTYGESVYRHAHAESRLRILPGGSMVVDGDRSFGHGANIEIFGGGELIVKKGPWTNVNFCIVCQDRILLDEWSMIGRDVTIRDNNGGHPIGIYGARTHMPVVIGKHAWLTSNCTVMMGVKIGDGAIIGAHALVTSSIPANCVANGNPAKVTQKGVLWRQ